MAAPQAEIVRQRRHKRFEGACCHRYVDSFGSIAAIGRRRHESC